MKLGVKIFFYVTIFFSAAFLTGGYALLSYFYEMTMKREIESAVEQYQYNKFVIQAHLITKGADWLEGVADGTYDIGSMASDMNDAAAVFSMDGRLLYSGFPKETDLSGALGGLLKEVAPDRVSYLFAGIKGRTYLLTAGVVSHDGAGVYLVTGEDVESTLEQQRQVITKFGTVYGVTIGVGSLLIFALSFTLTKPVKQLSAAAQKIADGNYKERVATSGNDEVGQLARNFNRMAIAVEEKVQELSDSARQKEDFVTNFAHELKTPLTSIIGYADRIYQKELPRKEQRQAAWYIWNEGMRLESLALKLMDLTVLNHKDFVLREENAEELFRELAADVEYLTAVKGVSLQCAMEEAERVYIEAEYDLFKTLFLNLIDNSIKAGATRISVTGMVNRRENATKENTGWKRQYLIQITDNGSGIPPQEIKRITEAFYMVDKSRSRRQHGAGIGLALAEKIAQIHGGTLEFESDGVSWTRVGLRLRCREVKDDEDE